MTYIWAFTCIHILKEIIHLPLEPKFYEIFKTMTLDIQ